jgi:hypothetical protein
MFIEKNLPKSVATNKPESNGLRDRFACDLTSIQQLCNNSIAIGEDFACVCAAAKTPTESIGYGSTAGSIREGKKYSTDIGAPLRATASLKPGRHCAPPPAGSAGVVSAK